MTTTPTQYGMLEDTFSIRGMEVQRYIDPARGTEIWKPIFLHPFEDAAHRLRVSLNDKLLETAYEKRITGIVIGGRVVPPPSPKELREKVKRGEYEVKESYFGVDQNYKLYYFYL